MIKEINKLRTKIQIYDTESSIKNWVILPIPTFIIRKESNYIELDFLWWIWTLSIAIYDKDTW